MQARDIANALDPSRNVVVEACAGSGKTWLLISRVLRLLLAGIAPSEILAITFTRKAAQEMTARLTEWLAELALMPEDRAREFLEARGVAAEDMASALQRAPLLFERYQTSVPAMTVSTFHGWFLQVLQSMPLSGGVARDAVLIEQTSLALHRAWRRYLDDMQSAEAPTRDALLRLFERLGLHSTQKLLFNFVAKRAEWWAYTAGQSDPVGYALRQLEQEFGSQTAEDATHAFINRQGDELRAFAEFLLASHTASNCGRGQTLAVALDSGDAQRIIDGARSALYTQKGEPLKFKPSKERVKRIGEAAEARFLELHEALCMALAELERALAAAEILTFNADGINCGAALLETYQALKRERREVDFTDIEWRAAQLFVNSEHTDYLSYKLDTRYRHVLIDEFQDTNPLQWQALLAWLRNAAAAGAQPGVFLVGDPKQSIYRFRRAESRLFGLATQFLQQQYDAERIALNTSRRCAPAVVEVLNRVFESDPDYEGFETHTAHHVDRWGRIAVSELMQRGDKAALDATIELRNPLETPRTEHEDQRYAAEAQRLVANIREIVGRLVVEDPLGARFARYDDIMVLARRRTKLDFFEAALRQASIPYLSGRAGGLLATLECKDMISLLSVLNHPLGDLALAQVLRSPLFGLTDAELAAIASQAPASWWEKFSQIARNGESSKLRTAHAALARWMALADKLPVHDLLDQIFHEANVINRYRAAVAPVLRETVAANLRAFTALALSIDEGRYPSLPRFLEALRNIRYAASQDTPDEGDVSAGINAVSIMTVHAAKGLERSVVFLIDCEGGNQADRGYDVLVDWPPESVRPKHFSVYQRSGDKRDPRHAYFEHEKKQQERESMNMLYVAMTRAKQVFIASGCQLKGATTGWHKRMAAALLPFSPTLDYSAGALSGVHIKEPFPATSPSQFDAEWTAVSRPPADVPDPARRYGITLHTLLESLAPPARGQTRAALRLICRSPDDEFDRAWEAANAILGAPALRRFFDPNQYARALNELSLNINGELRRIDRLIEFDDAIWLIDYKATHAANQADALRAQYAAQLALYRNAIEQVFAKPVRTALVLGDATLLEI